MNEILVNDIFDDLREENERLRKELFFEKDLNKILENIKNYSIILKNNCNCSENIEVFKKLNDFEIDYKILKSKQKDIKTGIKTNVYENGFSFDMNAITSGIHISNVKSIARSDENKSEESPKSRTNGNVLCNVGTEQLCNECDQPFETELDLLLHINRNHKDLESYVCHECRQVFNTKEVFSRHLLKHKTKEETGLSAPKPKSKPTTITDYLRSYRKCNPSETNGSIKKESSLRLITEMLKPIGSSKQMDNNSGILSINDIKVESNRNSFECRECHRSWKSMEILESHIRKSHPCLLCSKCNQLFASKDEVFQHLSTFHKIRAGAKLYQCQSCRYKTPSRSNYSRHKSRKVCSKGSFKCTSIGCTASFTQSFLLRKHRQHCPKRSKSTDSNNNNAINVNTNSVHPINEEDGQYLCSFCPFKAKARYRVIEHQRTHSTERPFACDIKGCHHAYKRKSHLQEHKKRVHKDRFQINLLKQLNKNIRNVSKLDFNDDQKSSEDEVNEEQNVSKSIPENIKLEFISDSDNESIILKDFTESMEMESGLDGSQQLTDAKYCCKLCNFTSETKVFLMLHEIQEHPKVRPYKCEFPNCGKAYTRADHLDRHIRESSHYKQSKTEGIDNGLPSVKVSENGKLFECDVCHYKTKFVHLLRRHLICHSSDRPFKCELNGCGYTAKRRDILRSHQKRVHKKESPTFTCNYPKCRRIFDSLPLLKQHFNCHKNRFVCRFEGCQHRTDTFAKLNEHRRNEKHVKPEPL